MTPAQSMFAVDVIGLRKLLADRGKENVLYELFQNAADEDGVTRIDMRLDTTDRRGLCHLRVEDDSPKGFTNIAHAWTLFAESEKKNDPTKRGRWNFGEKAVLVLCKEATISTTTGEVKFADGKREEFPRRKRQAGTVFEAMIHMTKAEHQQACLAMQRLLTPAGIEVTFNGVPLPAREPLLSVTDITLPTVIADQEGSLRPSRRKTTLRLYEKPASEKAWICEMGVPVVECDFPCHVDVQQKVPLGIERNNVTPAYLRELSAHVLNAYAAHMSDEDATAAWVNTALEDPNVTAASVDEVLTKRFGSQRVVNDPSDPDATKLAAFMGYTVIPSRTFTKPQWENVRKAKVVLPAGQVTPSPKLPGPTPELPLPMAEMNGDSALRTAAEAVDKAWDAWMMHEEGEGQDEMEKAIKGLREALRGDVTT